MLAHTLQLSFYFRYGCHSVWGNVAWKDRGAAIKNGDRPIAHHYVLLREEFDDWAILFNPDTGRGFGLSPTGVYVWRLLDGEHTIDEMVTALRRDALDIPENARDGVGTFVDALVAEGLAGFQSTVS